jgi:hypothetical protein
LFGISFGHHHKNESFRFGFRMVNDFKIDICYYYYFNGIRTIEKVCELDYDKTYAFYIYFGKKDKLVKLNIVDEYHKSVYYTAKPINVFKWWGYTLGLYIGGNNPAPHTIKIKMG